jgi:hypothetical protein
MKSSVVLFHPVDIGSVTDVLEIHAASKMLTTLVTSPWSKDPTEGSVLVVSRCESIELITMLDN